MKLSAIFDGVKDYQIFGNCNQNVENLSQNSKKKAQNTLFFCINGTKTNGANYIFEAQKNGAVAIVTQKKLDVNITQVVVDDVRRCMAVASANFFGNPQKKLKIVGITGTSGKTSCTYILSNLLKMNKKNVGVIGTNGVFVGEKKLDLHMTTPDSIELFEIFAEMVNKNIEYCLMEVSAHAIFFDKIFGINFAVKALTNVKTDHLDFFKTQKKYEQTKQNFFCKDQNSRNFGERFVVNVDDNIGKKIAKLAKNCLTFGKNTAFLQFYDAKCSIDGTTFFVKIGNKNFLIKTKLLGVFNVYNILLCIGVMLALGFEAECLTQQISHIKNIAGRCDIVFLSDDFSIVIDYAHTTDSLKNFLLTIKSVSDAQNIIVLGSPGQRETQKRCLMGRLAGEFCESVIFTSDNPATDNAKRIMFEMAQGAKNTKARIYCVENRKKAIQKAIKMAKTQKNCNVLIVGKGIENYQIVGDKFVEYSDYTSAFEALDKLNVKNLNIKK